MSRNFSLSVISPTVNNIGCVYLVICNNEFYYYVQIIGKNRYRIQQIDQTYLDFTLKKSVKISQYFPFRLRYKKHRKMNLIVSKIFPYDKENEDYFGFCKLIPE